MRISDWSSDVCSSELQNTCVRTIRQPAFVAIGIAEMHIAISRRRQPLPRQFRQRLDALDREHGADQLGEHCRLVAAAGADFEHARSEEHTSELQSLMRISYAGF